MDTRTIFFIGKPGCGKGTQAKLLSEKTGWKILSGGDQFRAIAKEDTPVGHKVKTLIEAGELSPYWFSMYIYLRELFAIRANEGFIFDGAGRRAPEAQLIIDSLTWLDRPFKIIEIQVSDESVRTRIAVRKGIENRADDSAVGERLKEYREHTEPAIDLFRKAGVLVEIDGEPTPEEIALQINKTLNI